MADRKITGYETYGDARLLAENLKTAARERESIEALLRQLAEIERRKLYAPEGYSSLYMYCRRKLRYSEGEAVRRAQVSRMGRDYPSVFRMIGSGQLSLNSAALLYPHICRENWRDLLRQAAGRSVREVERITASLSGRPIRRDRVRRLAPVELPAYARAAARNGGTAAELPFGRGAIPAGPNMGAQDVSPSGLPAEKGAPAAGAQTAAAANAAPPSEPASTTRPRETVPGTPPKTVPLVEISFTAGEALLRKVERARELLRHRLPGMQFEHVFDAALDALLDKHDPERILARKEARAAAQAERRPGAARAEAARQPASGTSAPSEYGEDTATPRGGAAEQPGSQPASHPGRRIPQRVKDEVYRRDEGRCTYVSPAGERCEERGRLEYDHVVPFALGGPSDDPKNLRLRCRPHNLLAAEQVFGQAAMRAAMLRARSP